MFHHPLQWLQNREPLIKELLHAAEKHFYKSQYQAAIDALQEASQAAQKIEDWESYVQAENDLGAIYNHLSQYSNALIHLHKAIKAGEEQLSEKHLQVAESHNIMGCVLTHENQYEQGEKHFAKAISIYQNKPNHLRELSNTYNNKGWFFGEMGKYVQSLHFHQLALKIRLESVKKRPNEVAQSYNNIGACYIFTGDTNKALTYYQKALNIWRELYGNQHAQTAIAYNNIGWSYSQQADFKTALEYYQKTLEIRTEIFEEKHIAIAQSFENIAYCLTKLQQFDEALQSYHKGLDIRSSIVPENHPTLVKIYRNLGQCHLERKDFEASIQYLNKALKIYQDSSQETTETIILHNLLGEYYEQTKQYLNSIQAYHHVLQSAIPNYQTDDYYETPSLEKYYHKVKLGYALNHKAKGFLDLYLQNQVPKDLSASLAHFKKAVQVLNENRQSYTNTASKLNHAKLVVRTYEWAIYAHYISYQQSQNIEDFSTAFSFAELSKSYVLLSKIKETEAQISAHIPSEILQKEQSLQTEMSSLDKRIQQLKLKTKNKISSPGQEEMMHYLQGKYFDVSLQYDQVIEEIERDYPQYFQLKYDLQTTSPTQIRAQLSSQKILVNYFVGIENLFIFAISKSQFHFHCLPKPDDLTDTIEYIHDAIGMGDEDDLQDLGAQLFETLLTFFLSKESDCNQLVIIPDDCLHRLPFDVLWGTHKPTQHPEESYLIQNFQIGYHYSATLWSESQKNKTKPSQVNSFLGIAPINFEGINDKEKPTTSIGEVTFKSDFNTDGQLKELQDSKDEIQQISQLFTQHQLSTTTLFYQQATKENFLQQLKGKKYIVLSSHGFYNEENPVLSGIYFARGEETGVKGQGAEPTTNHESPITNPLSTESMKLYISDTFHLQLDADLVVLSSCESGIGELQKGEGMLALNRGFLYAGATNIIYSLFKVPDAASQLTPNFFRCVLQENMTYAAALQKAKLDLIAAGQEPLYWAGFALVGK
ncbi:MAG: tetratricopeptide repeat protein [Chitinophagales bacterium]